MADEDNVVAFARPNATPDKPHSALGLQCKKVGRYCRCTFFIDQETRTVTCKKCKRVWDPFDAILFIAEDWERIASHTVFLRRESSELQKQCDELKAEVTKLKAQKRRAQTGTDGRAD